MILWLRLFVLLLSAALIVVVLRPVVSEYYVTRAAGDPRSSILKAWRITGEDARYPYLLGHVYQTRTEDNHLEKAIDAYRSSLEKDPTRAFTWLALSRAYSNYGKQTWAEYAIRKAVWVDRANPRVIWEAGMFYLAEGNLKEAAAHLRHYLFLAPSRQEDLYTMLHAAGVSPSFLMEQVLPPDYQFHTRYLRFLMAYKQHAALADIWELRNSWRPKNADYLAYCDLLIDMGKLQAAQDVWAEFIERNYPAGLVPHTFNMIFNGDFERAPQDAGFDWKTGSADGVRIFRDKDIKKSGRASLAVRFSGKTNPGIYIAQQWVIVEPKQRYRLLWNIKTDRLTTHNGILLEVLGQGSSSLAAKSEVVTGTNDWKPIELEFTTPADCSLVKIGIKRERSEKFDNKISGTAWLDNFKMTEVKN